VDQYKILNYYFCHHVYKNTTHDICHHIFMYDGKDKNTDSQKHGSIKYISNTHGGVMRNKIYCNSIMINIYFRVCFKIINRWKRARDR